MKFSSPTAFMAEKKSIVEEAFPGDIVGLHDTGNFKIGDTLTEGELIHYKGAAVTLQQADPPEFPPSEL